MALLLANGSMSSGSGGEGQIRQALIEADLAETAFRAWKRHLSGRVGVPPAGAGVSPSRTFENSGGSRNSERSFGQDAQTGGRDAHPTRDYADVPGFCKSATREEITAHGFVLTPGRYVGAEDVEYDGEPFEEKMTRLVSELETQFAESAKLESAIRQNLAQFAFKP